MLAAFLLFVLGGASGCERVAEAAPVPAPKDAAENKATDRADPPIAESSSFGPQFWLDEEWKGSGLIGHRSDRGSYWTPASGARAIWRPNFGGPVRAKVEVYIISHGNENGGISQCTVRHAQGEDVVRIELAEGEKSRAWRELGTYDFAGTADDAVTLTKVGGAMARVSAARFGVIGGSGEIIQSIVIDVVNAGPTVDPTRWEFVDRTFADIAESAHEYEIRRLANRGIVGAAAGEQFRPDDPITAGAWALWLTRAAGRIQSPVALHETSVTADTQEDLQAAFDRAVSAGMVRGVRASSPLAGDEIVRSLAAAVDMSGRDGAWLDPRGAGGQALTGRSRVTRAQAASALWWFVEEIAEAGPPLGPRWELTLLEEFDGDALDLQTWRVQAGSPGHIMSSRWPENVEVARGLLRLHTRKEERGGKAWTTGNIWTRTFEQQYGYFEARLRCGNATGLNNAFWLMNPRDPDDPRRFEIDMTEARHPNQNLISVHNWGGKHTVDSELVITEESTSRFFHVYACEWTPTRVTFYFNGRPLRTVEHDYCRRPSPIRLSSAVGMFAGQVTDALDGTVMEVDYVRVFTRDYSGEP